VTEPSGAPATEPAVAGRPPTRRISLLVGIALVAALAVVAIVALTKPATATVAKGQPVPEIRGTALDGSTVDLASLRGKPVVINFWGPSCPPCVTELPLLASKLQEHAASGLQIVGVLTDDPVEGSQAFATAHGATWPTVIDPDKSIKTAYQVIGRPQSYFVDRDGVLRSIQVGYLTDADFERQFAQISGGS
jgi:cytochrome c biogenesis protein CcmG, thiol:disulfide interchange protein DsbE